MLTRKDLDQINEIVSNRIKQDVPEILKAAFQDFYTNIFEPYANKNDKEHKEMIQEIKAIKRDTEELQEHGKRLRILEELTSVKN